MISPAFSSPTVRPPLTVDNELSQYLLLSVMMNSMSESALHFSTLDMKYHNVISNEPKFRRKDILRQHELKGNEMILWSRFIFSPPQAENFGVLSLQIRFFLRFQSHSEPKSLSSKNTIGFPLSPKSPTIKSLKSDIPQVEVPSGGGCPLNP